MRRVMATIGFSFLFTAIITLYFGVTVSLFIAAAAALLMLCALAVPSLRRVQALPLLMCCIMLSSLNTAAHLHFDVQPTIALANQKITVNAELLDYPDKQNNKYEYRFRTLSVEQPDTKQQFDFYMITYEPLDVEPFDRIHANIELKSDGTSAVFDYGNGLYVGCFSCSDLSVQKTTYKPLRAIAVELSHYFKQAVNENNGAESRGLLNGLLFSDKSGISDELNQSIRACGLSHTTAVSGLHMSIVIMSLFTALLSVGLRRKSCVVISIIATLVYLSIVGFPYSAARASIMLIIYLLSCFASRPADAPNSIGAATLVFVLINPYSAINASYLLSAAATLGMATALNRIIRYIDNQTPRFRFRKQLAVVTTPFLQSLCAMAFTLPMTYLFFGQLSIVSPFANMLVVPLVAPVIVLGMLQCLLAWLPIAANVIGRLLNFLICVIIAIVNWFAALPGATVFISERYIGIVIACCLAAVAVAVLFISLDRVRRRSAAIRCCAYCCVIFLLTGMFANSLTLNGTQRLSVLSSGSGGCVVVQTGNQTIVIGAGGNGAAASLEYTFQRKALSRMSLLLLPSDNPSYAKCASEVIVHNKPELLLADNGIYSTIIPADKIMPYTGCCVKINDHCTVYGYASAALVCCGDTEILLTDSKTAVAQLPEKAKNAECVIVCDLPPADIGLLNAKTAVLCSDNNDCVSTLQQLGISVYSAAQNDLDIITHCKGDISFSKEVRVS